ncbi:IS5-like element ISOpb2 family transposase [Geminisphaera colitermitum]|uniref:IS5-like element ISOpb2 family transposase n=1 Tax=Geminisphaera colitermitum TaxID=1148786 RepID=UPI000158D33C|nr:IS5-like element ISOpb2 family transposase [Geminisphaera colitermitum]
MKPKENKHERQREMFKMELIMLVNMNHPMVKLAGNINWAEFDKHLGPTYHERLGQPGLGTRLMVSLHYLKYQYDLSDEEVLEHWVENPYWQYLSGMQYFEHEKPIDSSSMTRWRKRLGESGAEQMLKQTIESAVRMKGLKPVQVVHINVDTTVQTKEIRYPTDARSYDRARERLVKEARKAGLKVKQSYERVGRGLLMMAGRYMHSRKMKRTKACVRKLRTNLGRVIREIERQKPVAALQGLLETSKQIYKQKTADKNKVYSVHEPKVKCISKGKSGKKYEFGQKVSVASTSKGGWLLGALCMPDNPYDGHTLEAQMEQVKRLYIEKQGPKTAHVDMGYRGHNYEGPVEVIVDKRRRGKIPKRVWRWMKRRAAIEPTIGHLKNEHRMERNKLRGLIGDKVNAILSAAAMNFGKLLAFLLAFFSRLLLALFPALRTSPCFKLA